MAQVSRSIDYSSGTGSGVAADRDRGGAAGREVFLTGLDRHRADSVGQQLTPVPGLSSTTAAGLARQMTSDQWRAVETGLAVVTERLVGMLPAAQTEGQGSGVFRECPHLS
jgi:hypothetical protein